MKKNILLICVLFIGMISAAQAGVIRDAESERTLKEISAPIFVASGLNPDQIRIVIINEDSINAFVAGGQNLFLHSGLLLDAKSVDELGGVIAHEAGHIAGGHLIRIKDSMQNASIESVIGALAGLAVGVGAGDAQAGVGVAVGSSELAKRRFLRHSRVFESSADQSALTTIENRGYSSQGMADFLERLSAQEILPETQRSAYIMTHPLSRERLDTVTSFVARSPKRNTPWPRAWNEKFLRMQAKILAFTQPQRAEQFYKGKSGNTASYAMAISAYRQGRIAEALQGIVALQKQEPQNGYLNEIEGQILFEQGKINEAISAYRIALKKEPQEALIHLALAQALLQDENNKSHLSEALSHLLQARDKGEQYTSSVQRWLAIAYGRSGQTGMAKLSLAEEALLKRRLPQAIEQANQALKLLPKDSVSARQRANDLLNLVQRIQDER
jgi:predicted Zn-dependent protease